jgi:enamine deaminase RidA (YjgF/YER057c/UK114 family)
MATAEPCASAISSPSRERPRLTRPAPSWAPAVPFDQAKFIFQKIEKALIQAGSSLKDVVRVRTFITDISRWEDVARAQGDVFGDIRPAATLVQVSALISPDLLVEIEVDAIV